MPAREAQQTNSFETNFALINESYYLRQHALKHTATHIGEPKIAAL